MQSYLIKNATIVNENKIVKGSVLTEGNYIKAIYTQEEDIIQPSGTQLINAEGLILIPGAIDDQVHFRQPGLTHKGDLYTESIAAAAGGVTSIMEMPNTNPQTVTQQLLTEKYQLGAENSVVNYSFYLGATNHNLDEILQTNPREVCGIKIFMGSSTGNMLVDNKETLTEIFKNCKLLIATHCEDESTIKQNLQQAKEKFGDNIPPYYHPVIRNHEVCYKSSSFAVELAAKYGTRLHVLHISTAKELELFNNHIPLKDKKITAEACIHHLWFNDTHYAQKGNFIRWNPAIKTESDRIALFQAVLNNTIDVIATDHAPHTLQEKSQSYLNTPSGGPLVQHSIQAMMEFYFNGLISLEKIVEKMAHAVADLFQIEKRGYIRPGYYADLVLINPNKPYTVTQQNLLYKCKWSPFEGYTFKSSIEKTFINGHLVYSNRIVDQQHRGMRLTFNR
jgi:dihydroorotase